MLEQLLASPHLSIIRCKNRFQADYATMPIGGYRDLQLQVAFIMDDDEVLGEVQINLKEFVRIAYEEKRWYSDVPSPGPTGSATPPPGNATPAEPATLYSASAPGSYAGGMDLLGGDSITVDRSAGVSGGGFSAFEAGGPRSGRRNRVFQLALGEDTDSAAFDCMRPASHPSYSRGALNTSPALMLASAPV